LLGEDHREAGLRSLAHLGLVDRQGDAAVATDPEPCVGSERGIRGRRCRHRAWGQIEGDHEAGAGLDKIAAGDVRMGVHDGLSLSELGAWYVVRGCWWSRPCFRFALSATTHHAPRTPSLHHFPERKFANSFPGGREDPIAYLRL